MGKFIEIGNGDLIHSESIKAIRLGEPRPKGEYPFETELKPRIIVDLLIGDHANCIVLEYDTIDQRNKVASDLKDQVVCADLS